MTTPPFEGPALQDFEPRTPVERRPAVSDADQSASSLPQTAADARKAAHDKLSLVARAIMEPDSVPISTQKSSAPSSAPVSSPIVFDRGLDQHPNGWL